MLLRRAFSSRAAPSRDVVILSYARTPIGAFNGSLASISATALGAAAVRGALSRAGVDGSLVDEVIMGNVVSAGLGQAPARQAARGGGVRDGATCFTVNKVCASGTKAVALAAQSIALGSAYTVVAGGFESMSGVPYYAAGARGGLRLGHAKLLDGVIHDGLWDPYGNEHMGSCAEKTARELEISRAQQDAYAARSYARALADAAGRAADIVPVTPPKKGSAEVRLDDEPSRGGDAAALAALRPAFLAANEGGTITAGNASKLNDGGAALVLMSARRAQELGLTPLARVLGYADAEAAPVDFSTAPSLAVPRALKHAGVSSGDVALHEVNEAFSSVALANMRLLSLAEDCVNVAGGAVALGHPIGASGARIVGQLMRLLRARNAGAIGVASICNGGGGATALVIEAL
jgi:acetyl-CoA C-acetyltransferase